MPIRDTFTMSVLAVPEVIFPGIVSSVTICPRSAGAAARVAASQDQSLVLAWSRHDRPPATIATTGRLLSLTEIPDGWQVVVAGIQRVEILTCRHQGTHLMGHCRYISDQEESIPVLLAEESWALASELWATVHDVGTATVLPQNAHLLAYWIGAHMPLSAPTRQELLELPTTRSRLAKEVSLMRTLLDGLRTEHQG